MSETRSQLVELDDHMVRIAHAASTDIAKPSLCAVSITEDRIEATDGHVLVRCDPPADMPEDIRGLYCAKEFGKIRQLAEYLPALVSRTNDRLIVNEGYSPKAMTVECEDGPYPNTDRVWPQDTDADIRIGLRADTLKKLLSALPRDDAHIWITVPKGSVSSAREATAAMTFTVSTGERGNMPSSVRGLIMPCEWPGK